MINRKYHLFNAEDKVLGRLATEISLILRGKNKVDFAPQIDGGDFVVLINAAKVKVTGRKTEDKVYHRFSGYPGGITSIKFKDQMEKDFSQVFKSAVYSMLPKNKLRDKMIKRLLVYRDDKHQHKIDITH